jgi:hypothetical protein
MSWTQKQAIEFAKILEGIAPEFGCHVALTGGCLYGDGERKDADFVFYRIRQEARIKIAGLFSKLAQMNVTVLGDYGFVVKANWGPAPGKHIDFLFPEADRGGEDYAALAAAEEFTAVTEDVLV